MSTTTTGFATQLITFSRGSLATVTDADGRIKWAPHNLLLASEQFDASSWVKTNVTVAANSIAAPNGTTTADKLIATNTSGVHRTYQTGFLGVSKAGVIYARAAEYNFISIGQTTGDYAVVNLTTGAVTQSSGTIPAPVSVGSGWWRIEIANTTVDYVLSVVDTGTFTADQYGSKTFTGDNTSGVYVWGAHLYRSDLGGMQANASAYPMYNPSTPRNLLGFTELLTTGWTNTNTTDSQVSVAGPTTSANSIEVTATAGNGTLLASLSLLASPYTFSIWLKRKTGTGTIEITVDGTTYVTAAVTTDWQRFSTTLTPSAGTKTPGIRIVTNGDAVYAWGAQLSDSASLDPYVGSYGAAPSAAAAHGPRLDYDGSTLAAKGLLVEEQRANLLLHSEDFTNGVWAPNNATVAGNSIASPSGLTTGDTLTRGAGNTIEAMVRYTTSQAINTTYTLSVFAKAGSAGALLYLRNIADNNTLVTLATFALDGTNTVTPNANFVGSTRIVSVGNGWYRCSITSATGGTISGNLVDIGCSNSPGVVTGTSGAFIYLYGAQFEAGSFPTSYIPTGASTVTRNADVASVATSQFPYSATEGTVVVSGSSLSPSTEAGSRYMAILYDVNAGISNAIRLDKDTNSWRVVKTVGGVSEVASVTFTTTNTKIAAAYASSNSAASFNGSAASSISGGVPSAASMIAIGSNGNTTGVNNVINGWIRQITYIPRRLGNAELQQRTA